MNYKKIARQYGAIKKKDYSIYKQYMQLWEKIYSIAKQIEKKYNVMYTSNDFYSNALDMFDDIDKNNTIKIYNWGGEHPFWNWKYNKYNLAFRLVHDIFGHYKGRNSFMLHWEYKAMMEMFKHHSYTRTEKNILFTEIVGQGSYTVERYKLKRFVEQRAWIIEYFK